MKYYVYRHIRLDKNEPFYIGIGTKPMEFTNNSREFKRAYSKQGRNNIWNSIINKTNYRVEIIYETDIREEIINKEKEFIKLYGNRMNKGTLVNLTEGGDGRDSKSMLGKKNSFYGKTHNLETRNKMSDSAKKRGKSKELIDAQGWSKGLKLTEKQLQVRYNNGENKVTKTVVSFTSGKKYYSLAEACRKENLKYRQEKDRVSKKTKTSKFYYENTPFSII